MGKPSVSTIKRLFAVSGNQCAFPNCTSKLVDIDTGTVIGDICHIKARNAGGPRYDINQTEKERHGYDNLILMCSQHNTLIDDNPKDYTVEILTEIKRKHEAKSNCDNSLSSAQAIDFIQKLDIKINNVGTIQTQNISIGLSFADARQIAMDVFNANFYRLAGEAQNIARQRADEILEKYLERIATTNPDDISSANDPDMQYALYRVQREYARSGNKDLSDILVDILADRAHQNRRSLLQIVLNESIDVAPKLTPPQFDTLSLVFILRYTQSGVVNSRESFINYFDTFITPFQSGLRDEISHFQHLEYAGCGSIQVSGISIQDIFRRVYPGLFSKGIEYAQIEELFKDKGDCSDMFIKCLNDKERFQINAINSDTVNSKLNDRNFTKEEIDKVIETQKSNLMNDEEIKDYLTKSSDKAEYIIDGWNTSSIRNYTLTSVGMAIAHANMRRRINETFDLSTWIVD